MIEYLQGFFGLLDIFEIYDNLEAVFSPSNIFLITLGLIWILIAVIQDFRKREVANWWNFSLIVFVLAFRAFLSVFINLISSY